MNHYGKRYTDKKEYYTRKSIFEANLQKILAHNQDTTKTWKEEINHLADWTPEVIGRGEGGGRERERGREEAVNQEELSMS